MSLALGGAVLCLVVVAVRDVRTILRLSNEEARLSNSPDGSRDADLVWIGGPTQTQKPQPVCACVHVLARATARACGWVSHFRSPVQFITQS